MKQTPRVFMMLFLGASFAIQMACAPAPPANTNQPSVNANSTPSNSSQTKASEHPSQSTTGTIEVISVPPGARVLLIATDGDTAGEPQLRGTTPTTITGVQPGKYTVHLERPGYRSFQKDITVRKGSSVKISATLRKQ